MDERAEILRRIEEARVAIAKSKSKYLRKDLQKFIVRQQKKLKRMGSA